MITGSEAEMTESHSFPSSALGVRKRRAAMIVDGIMWPLARGKVGHLKSQSFLATLPWLHSSRKLLPRKSNASKSYHLFQDLAPNSFRETLICSALSWHQLVTLRDSSQYLRTLAPQILKSSTLLIPNKALLQPEPKTFLLKIPTFLFPLRGTLPYQRRNELSLALMASFWW